MSIDKAALAAMVLGGALLAAPGLVAQTKVKTQTIEMPPAGEEAGESAPVEPPPEAAPTPEEPAGEPPVVEDAPADEVALPEVMYDLSRLPEPVARMRQRILEAAKTGDIEKLRPVIEINELPPVFTFGDAKDPIEFWKSAGGDPEGREIMAIMIEILEAGFVHLDAGTPQEMYVWPYFYGLPLDGLTPQQEVELYKLITPQDRKGMEDFGAYVFYRLGIAPDGTWHFFVAGD